MLALLIMNAFNNALLPATKQVGIYTIMYLEIIVNKIYHKMQMQCLNVPIQTK